jgi:Tol biopolymer transport system component
VTFYKVTVDGTVTPQGTHAFGGAIGPEIAPDGQHVVYSANDPRGGPDAVHMLTLPAGAPGDIIFDHQASPISWGWAPDSQHYAYTVIGGSAADRSYSVAVGGAAPQTFASNMTQVRAAHWVDGNHLVYMARIGGGEDWSLYQQALGGEPVLVAAGITGPPSVDVRSTP